MSSDPDRIAVPTNGRRPHPVPTVAATEAPAAPPGTTPGALAGGLTPQQIMVGFGIVASLVALAAGLARRRLGR